MDVGAWLRTLGLEEHAEAFAENGVDAALLPELTNDDLKDLGVARLADRKRLLKEIAKLAGAEALAPPDRIGEPTLPKGERRQLTVMDLYTRECLSIEVGQSIRGEDVALVLDRLVISHGPPKRIGADNGSEFISKALDRWAFVHGMSLDFSRRGKPTDNAFIESFSGSFRDECLNVHWFLSLADAEGKVESWRWDINNFRPHSSLGDVPPSTFIEQIRGASQPANPNL